MKVYDATEKELLLQQRLQQFSEYFSEEVGETVAGAVIVIQWHNSVSQGVILNVTPSYRKKVIENMAQAFIKTIESVKAKLSLIKNEDKVDDVSTEPSRLALPGRDF